jgi:pre-mRNA-processing factor SLU7
MRELPDGSQTTDDPKLTNGNQEFVRAANGDAAEFEKLQRFAWQSERMGGDVHLQANPTEGELRHRKTEQEQEKKKAAVRSSVLEKYGGAEHLAAPPKELLKSSEKFVEYTKMGEVIRGKEEPKTKSRYAEDGTSFFCCTDVLAYNNNHTSVYGSWFRDGRWGYACCHQFQKNSYCTGEAGIEADLAAQRLARGEMEMPPPPIPKKEAAKLVDGEAIRDAVRDSTKRKRPDESARQFEDRGMSAADKAHISEEEYEEWRRNKMARSDDPLYKMESMEGRV